VPLYALGIKFPVNCYTSKKNQVSAVTSGINLLSLYIARYDFKALMRTEMPLVDETKVAGGGRICFRGDARHPQTVFSRGITPRDTTSKIELRERGNEPIPIHKEHEKFYKRAGLNVSRSREPAVLFPTTLDIAPETAVCVTARFVVAPIFPLKMRRDHRVEDETWIYTLYARSLFNTHSQQIIHAMNTLEKELAVRREIDFRGNPNSNRTNSKQFERYAELKSLSLLYGHELATKSISASDVISAIKCTRRWHGDSWTEGATYTLNKASLMFNSNCRAPKAVIHAVRDFMNNEPVTGEVPKAGSGFHKGQSAYSALSAVERRIQKHMDLLHEA
jgi:hypothetical protein